MIFHENRLLEDNSHEISYLNLSSAAVVIGALRVKNAFAYTFEPKIWDYCIPVLNGF